MSLGIQRCLRSKCKVPTHFRPGHKLATILPISLRTLHLEIEREQMDRDKNYCRDIVKGTVQQQTDRSIHLSHLVMEEFNPHYWATASADP